MIPGIFVARDFRAIEATLVGWFAGSQRVVRLAQLGIHDYFMAHGILYPRGLISSAELPDLAWSDTDLTRCFAALKGRFKGDGGPLSPREIAKRVIYLSLYVGTPTRMHDEYPDTFTSRKDAAMLQGALLTLLPEIRAWQWRICKQVDQSTTIKAPDGFIHRYYRVLQWRKVEGKWEADFGDDAKRLVAFLPQHMAAVIGKAAGRRIYYGEAGTLLAQRINPRWRPVDPAAWTLRECVAHPFLRLFIHDEWLCECPVTLADEVDQVLQAEMAQPVKELPLDPTWNMGSHLVIGSEGKRGRVWGEMT